MTSGPLVPVRMLFPGVPTRVGSRPLHKTSATVVASISVLLPGLSSVSALVTVTLLVMVPMAVGRTTMVTVAWAPLARSPRSQSTTPPASVQLSLGATETKEPGKLSESVTPVASPSPALLTAMV